MTRRELSDFLETGVKALSPKTTFGRGRLSEWNSRRDHVYPKVWQVTSQEDGVQSEFSPTMTPIDNWPVELRVAFRDSQDSTEEQYEELVDEADRLAQRLMYQYNIIVASTPLVTISGISRTPFIKKNADDITGVILRFTVQATDLTSNCP